MYTQVEHDRLIEAMRATGVTSLVIEAEGDALRLDLEASVGGVAPAPVAAQSPMVPVTSPGIGRFLARGDGDGLRALNVPTVIQPGEVLGYIQQGTTLLPVTATAGGQLTTDSPAEGTIFGYGDHIFSLEATS